MDTPVLISRLARAELEEARGMSPEARLVSAMELVELGLEMMKAGIRREHPGAPEGTVLQLLRDRLNLAEQLENARGIT